MRNSSSVTNTIKANKHYNSALYIANRLEDHDKRISLHETLMEISFMLKDEALAKAHKNKANEIKRAIEGLSPDFSDYKFLIDIKNHKQN